MAFEAVADWQLWYEMRESQAAMLNKIYTTDKLKRREALSNPDAPGHAAFKKLAEQEKWQDSPASFA